MTLRDALAAAVRESGGLDRAVNEWTVASAILSDPDFRAALVESVAKAWWGLDTPALADMRRIAAAIVARMLEAEA